MALTKEERQKVTDLKSQGYNTRQISGFIGGSRLNKKSTVRVDQDKKAEQEREPTPKESISIVDRAKETFGDVKDTISGIGGELTRARGEIGEAADRTKSGQQGFASGLLQSVGSGISALTGSFGQSVVGAGKVLATQGEEDNIKSGVGQVIGALTGGNITQDLQNSLNTLTKEQSTLLEQRSTLKDSNQDTSQVDNLLSANADGLKQLGQSSSEVADAIPQSKLADKALKGLDTMKTENPELYNNIIATGRIGEAALDLGGGGVVTKTLREGVEFATDLYKTTKPLTKIDDVVSHADDLITKNPSSYGIADDVVAPVTKRTDETAESFARRQAESTAPNVSISEKWAGLRTDTKRAIQGESETLKRYIDATVAKNSDTSLGGAYGLAEDRVTETASDLRKQLNEVGSEIGATREKLSTVKASSDSVKQIDDVFKKNIDNLNLEISRGKIRQKTNTPTKVGGSGDIRALNDMLREINVLKQDPRLETLIDVRAGLDTRIKFEKLSQGISNVPEGVALETRKAIADSAAKTVGETEAARLAEYSDYIQALTDLEEFTRRKAGSSYLLRVSQSARGTEANRLLDVINKYTGNDLRKDAVMLNLSTEVFGNQAQKTLLAQQLENAGVVFSGLRGDPNALAKLADKIADQLIDKEKIIIEAAQGI